MEMTSWYKMLKVICEKDGENFDNLICYPPIDQLKGEFEDWYGADEGVPFTAWGKTWVYFPLSYECRQHVGHALRHVCNIAMKHQGEY